MSGASGKSRVGFLYNHDAGHQLAHSAGVMRQLALSCREADIVAMFGDRDTEQQLRNIVGEAAADIIEWRSLELGEVARTLLAPLNRIAPVYRLARLRNHTDIFEECDLIVSTERTCLSIKRKLKERSPAFLFIPHGAGDRNVSYHPSLGGFDYMLVSGRKVADEMIRHGLARDEAIKIIGYPKFDLIDFEQRVKLFDNERRTFLYNPHFDPVLSSWYDHGPVLVDAFRSDPSLGNLIVAPHVMLFRKRLHISPEFKRVRMRPDVPGLPAGSKSGYAAPNVFVDLASSRLFDMSYTLSADAYIGDASSQIYEFLVRPRACYFIDTRGVASRSGQGERADALFWGAGPVFPDVRSLVGEIASGILSDSYRPRQIDLFKQTMDEPVAIDDEETSYERTLASDRAAEAIGSILRQLGRSEMAK